jgi:hypothetical protein
VHPAVCGSWDSYFGLRLTRAAILRFVLITASDYDTVKKAPVLSALLCPRWIRRQ